MSADGEQDTVPTEAGAPDREKPAPRWRTSPWLAAGELVVVLLFFVADWKHLIPFSKTPFLFLFAWISLRMRGSSWREVGLTRYRSWAATVGFGLALGVAMECLELFATQPLLAKITGRMPDLSVFAALRGNTNLLLKLLALAWIVAAFGEEMVYRGYLMDCVARLGCRTRAAWIASLLVVSVIFGMAHTYQGITGVVENAIAGLILGVVYLRCGRSLAVPIIAHGVTDSVDFLLIYFGKYPGM